MATKQVQEAEQTAIMQILYTRNDATSRHLAAVLKMPLRRVQRRLKQLEAAGHVVQVRDRVFVYWRGTIPF